MRLKLKIIVCGAVLTAALGAAQGATAREMRRGIDEYPNSIMRQEPTHQEPMREQQGASSPDRQRRRKAVPGKAAPGKAVHGKKRLRHGSSSPSPLPAYRSPLTPLGVAPQVIAPPAIAQPSAPSVAVPGVSGNAGPAFTPPRPAGQSFQDRAVNCVHAGSSIGVPPGRIGEYTRHCVNQ